MTSHFWLAEDGFTTVEWTSLAGLGVGLTVAATTFMGSATKEASTDLSKDINAGLIAPVFPAEPPPVEQP